MKCECKVKSKEKFIPKEGLPWYRWQVEYYPVNQIHKGIMGAAEKLGVQVLEIDGSMFSDDEAKYTFKGRRKKVKQLINLLIQAFGDKYYFTT